MNKLSKDEQIEMHHKLYDAYLSFIENNNEFGCGFFAFNVIAWTVQMLYDTAPCENDASELLEKAIKHGNGLHESSKYSSNKE